MGMPIITPGNSTCEQAVTNLIESVAMQENALSHILNAEGEKMQAIISMEDVTAGQLLSMNRSVDQMGNAAARLEMILQAKVELAGQLCSLPEDILTEEEGGGL